MMKRILIALFLVLTVSLTENVAYGSNDIHLPTGLYAKSAVLIDASNNRILFGKNENEVRAMASTTKIMTLVIALEEGKPDSEVEFSPYAASQPDVQLNAEKGERYRMYDLLNIMMEKSYNDVAVAIAEHIGAEKLHMKTEAKSRTREESRECVKQFISMMNDKAREIGCDNTYFITPNGLDAEENGRKHSTTAYELALISAYALKNPEVEKICCKKNYDCDEISGKRHVNISNANIFLDMMPGAVGMKTGFTGDAGYCFVGAVKQEGRSFVSVVLASGWPPSKSYKWKDTVKLMNYGAKNYFMQKILVKEEDFMEIAVIDGVENSVQTQIRDSLSMLCADYEKIDLEYRIKDALNAPVYEGDVAGYADVFIDGKKYTSFPIYVKKDVRKTSFVWFLKKFLNNFIKM